MPSSISKVRVAVRVRPLSFSEQNNGGKKMVNVNQHHRTISLGRKSETRRCFTYDNVFDSNTSQDDLYRDVSDPFLNIFLNGYNATILAYGQTSSGKTHTMFNGLGSSDQNCSDFDMKSKGLLPRFIEDIFESVAVDIQQQKHDIQISASFLEVYGDDVFDLLERKRTLLPVREDSNGEVIVGGLKYVTISNIKEAKDVLNKGIKNRTTASTLMNPTSSKSHAMFTISMIRTNFSPENSTGKSFLSRMTFVDLAGSERMKKTGAKGERAKEGIKINQELFALGNVIKILTDKKSVIKRGKVYVPYRQSKLTRLLQGVLGGNSQTLFLACISSSDTNSNETLSTLNYANRAKNIKNTLIKNVTAKAQCLHTLTNIPPFDPIEHPFKYNFHSMAESDITNKQTTLIIPQQQSYLFQETEVQTYIKQSFEVGEEKCDENVSSRYNVQQKKANIYSIVSSVSHLRKSDHDSLVTSIRMADNKPYRNVNHNGSMKILDQFLVSQRKDLNSEGIEEIEHELKEEKEKCHTLLLKVSQLEKENLKLSQELEKDLPDYQTMIIEDNPVGDKRETQYTLENDIDISFDLETLTVCELKEALRKHKKASKGKKKYLAHKLWQPILDKDNIKCKSFKLHLAKIFKL